MTATPTMARFPQIGRQNVNFVRKQRPHRDVVRQSLPHIGKYVIDTPRDEFLDWREQYFRYHESNRGVLRRKIESLPDVPKRWDMRTTHSIPHKDLRETVASPTTTPTESQADSSIQTAESSEIVSDKGSDRDKFSDPETILRMERQMTSQKFTTEQRNFSRNYPVNKMLHCNVSWSSSPPDDPSTLSLERTHPSSSRRQPSLDEDTGHHIENETEIAQTEHHLENFSNAVGENLTDPESRRRMNPARPSHRSGAYPSEDLSHHPVYSNVIDIKHSRSERRTARRHVDTCVVKSFHRLSFSTKNIGPSSKHSVGSRSMRLGEILKSSKAAPSPNGNGKFTRRRVLGMSTWPDESGAGHENKDGALTEDGDDDSEDEMWLSVVNTPLVDKRIYDRYANVKLLPIKK